MPSVPAEDAPLSAKLAAPSKPARRKTPPKAKPAPRVADETVAGLAEVFGKLADESRLKILLALAEHGELHVTALCDLINPSQPAISHHLALLLGARLVARRRDGKRNFYRLESTRVRDLLDQFFDDAGNGQKQLQMPGFSLAYRTK